MDFRILGPLEVLTPPGPVAISGRHHPKLLAVLLADANQTVPISRLVNVLWDHHPPSTADRQVQNIAAALRRQLGAAGTRLRKVGDGYCIDVEPKELDLLRCRQFEDEAHHHQGSGRLVEAERSFSAALAQWRGPSLLGLPGRGLERYAHRLDDYRLDLTEALVDVRLDLGRHESLLGELQRLHTEHPGRQRLTGQLMLAMYRSGRGPEALRVYADHVDRLADELGADPGKPLRDLHTAILREDPDLDAETPASPVRIVPMTLPAGTAAFTGRDTALETLKASVGPALHPLVVLTGVGGIGKTMLALHWAHMLDDRFPGGRLYLDLRGFASKAVTTEEAIRQLLSSIGVESRRIPAEPGAQLALYRNLIGDEPRLLLLDNARDAAQVRSLLPASPMVHTVVISRTGLTELVAAHGARVIELGTFTRDEAAELLQRQLGEGRTAADPASVERIITACAGLPLALAITAARAASRPEHPLSVIADELEAWRLDALAGGESTADLRAVFSWSYRFLEPDAARLFRLLALMPGPDFGLDSIVDLHGGSAHEAGRALRPLVDAHLVEHGRPGRFRLHDLLRLYAAELLEEEEPQAERDAAAERLLGWYLSGAETCRFFLYPEEAALPQAFKGPTARIGTDTEAAQWIDLEWNNLVAAVEYAAQHGPKEIAWLLADALRGHVWLGMRGGDGNENLRISRAALEAAAEEGDTLGRAAAELYTAYALVRANRAKEAAVHARDAADLAVRGGWVAGAAAAAFSLGAGAFYRGRMRDGLRHLRTALHESRIIGDRRAECTNLHWLGILHSLLGEFDPGGTFFDQALAVAAETGAGAAKAVLLTHMAEIDLFRGRLDLAAARLDEASELERAGLGHDRSGDVLGAIARLRLASGEAAEALVIVREVVETRTGAADHRIRTHAVLTQACALDALGDHRAAIERFDLALSMTDHEATEFHRVQALTGRSRALSSIGAGDRARTDATHAIEAARAGEYRFFESQALNRLAEIDLKAGRFKEADESARRALLLGRGTRNWPAEEETRRLLTAIGHAETETSST